MRANTNIQLKERRQFTIDNFRGVDYSTSPLKVQTNRASSMVNFINQYGVNKKRNGWIELCRIEDSDGTPKRINGIFDYINGEHNETIVHAGKSFYRLEHDRDTNIYSYSNLFLYGHGFGDEFSDTRSQAFLDKGRLYIIGCGDYLVYGTWDDGETYDLRRVAGGKDTYVPTTTISIQDESVTEKTSKRFEKINLLTPRRINRLLGSSTPDKTWILDSSIDLTSTIEITIETVVDGREETKKIRSKTATSSDLISADSPSEYAYTTCGKVDRARGKITLTIQTEPRAENMDNIFVTFNHAAKGSSEIITKCNFGILFGAGGNSDKLFLSGNSNFQNMDFYSDIGMMGYSDFTYFPDNNVSAVGSEAVPITGYVRLSDSSLAICKKENPYESTVFYRTGKYDSINVDGIEITNVKAVFKATAGNATNGAVNCFTCHNFCGDSVILSESGVCGLVLINSFTTERGIRERSFSVNEKLRKHKLSDSVSIVFQNRYYLSVDGVCYVADANYKYVKENDIDGSFNYEWWNWDNIPARVFANLNNELYFGSDKGQICVFDDKYSDRTLYVSKDGDFSMDGPKNKILYSKTIGFDFKENDLIQFGGLHSGPGFYIPFFADVASGKITKVKGNKIYLPEEALVACKNGIDIFFNALDITGAKSEEIPSKHGYLNDLDYGLSCFSLVDEMGETVELIDVDDIKVLKDISLHRSLDGEKLYITNVTKTSFQMKYLKDNQYPSVVKLVPIELALPPLRITHVENVIAKWFTPIIDLGTSESSKTLLKMTIVTEPTVKGKLSFGYETQRAQKMINAQGINVFSFDDFSFEDFSFDTEFARSYSVRVNERNFNFIMFKFVSDNDENCAINSFGIVYKINKSNIGVV